jgi:hypothetical protein
LCDWLIEIKAQLALDRFNEEHLAFVCRCTLVGTNQSLLGCAGYVEIFEHHFQIPLAIGLEDGHIFTVLSQHLGTGKVAVDQADRAETEMSPTGVIVAENLLHEKLIIREIVYDDVLDTIAFGFTNLIHMRGRILVMYSYEPSQFLLKVSIEFLVRVTGNDVQM